MTEEEEFFAWLDGELAPVDAARVEARVAADPTLAAEAEAHRAMTAGLRAAFDPVMTPKNDVIDLAAKRAQRARRVPTGLPQWAAIAATLVAGIALGSMVDLDRHSSSPIALEGGQMVAASALDETLTHQLASGDQSGDAPRVGLTFRNQQGEVCRTFSDSAAAGLACRRGETWRIEGLFGARGATTGAYRTASGADPRVPILVESMISGEPLDAAGEAAAKQSGWR
jgi:hypothetical protein